MKTSASTALTLLAIAGLLLIHTGPLQADDPQWGFIPPEDQGMQSEKGDIKLRGVALSHISRWGGHGWRVLIEEIMESPPMSEEEGDEIDVLTWYPGCTFYHGYEDPDIEEGDEVEVYGYYDEHNVVLLCWHSYDYYIIGFRGPSIGTPIESDDPINKYGCPDPTTVTITSEIRDPSGMDRARIYYNFNRGGWLYKGMIAAIPTSYSRYYATIGPFPEAGTVDYYIEAWDELGNGSQSSTGTITVQECPWQIYLPFIMK